MDVSRLFVAGHIIGDNQVKSLFLKQEVRKEKGQSFSRNNSVDSDLSNSDVLVQHSASVLLTLRRLMSYIYLWSSGQSFWLQIQRSRVRFPALPDFLSSSGSGTGSTQPRAIN